MDVVSGEEATDEADVEGDDNTDPVDPLDVEREEFVDANEMTEDAGVGKREEVCLDEGFLGAGVRKGFFVPVRIGVTGVVGGGAGSAEIGRVS